MTGKNLPPFTITVIRIFMAMKKYGAIKHPYYVALHLECPCWDLATNVDGALRLQGRRGAYLT
jgi:hypothetical protein